jgi:hypothetical protein
MEVVCNGFSCFEWVFAAFRRHDSQVVERDARVRIFGKEQSDWLQLARQGEHAIGIRHPRPGSALDRILRFRLR